MAAATGRIMDLIEFSSDSDGDDRKQSSGDSTSRAVHAAECRPAQPGNGALIAVLAFQSGRILVYEAKGQQQRQQQDDEGSGFTSHLLACGLTQMTPTALQPVLQSTTNDATTTTGASRRRRLLCFALGVRIIDPFAMCGWGGPRPDDPETHSTVLTALSLGGAPPATTASAGAKNHKAALATPDQLQQEDDSESGGRHRRSIEVATVRGANRTQQFPFSLAVAQMGADTDGKEERHRRSRRHRLRDATKTATLKYTGKEHYKFGDITKSTLGRLSRPRAGSSQNGDDIEDDVAAAAASAEDTSRKLELDSVADVLEAVDRDGVSIVSPCDLEDEEIGQKDLQVSAVSRFAVANLRWNGFYARAEAESNDSSADVIAVMSLPAPSSAGPLSSGKFYSRRVISAHADGKLRLWDVENSEQPEFCTEFPWKFDPSCAIVHLEATADSAAEAIGAVSSEDPPVIRAISIVPSEFGSVISEFPCREGVGSLSSAVTPDSRFLVCVSSKGQFFAWDADSGKTAVSTRHDLFSGREHSGPPIVSSVTCGLLEDATPVALCGSEYCSSAVLLRVENAEELLRLPGFPTESPLLGVHIEGDSSEESSPDETFPEMIHVFDPASGMTRRPLGGPIPVKKGVEKRSELEEIARGCQSRLKWGYAGTLGADSDASGDDDYQDDGGDWPVKMLLFSPTLEYHAMKSATKIPGEGATQNH